MIIYDAYKLFRLRSNCMMSSYYVPENSRYNIYYQLDTVIPKIEGTHGIFCFDNMNTINSYLEYCNIKLEDKFKLILKDTKTLIGVLAKIKTDKFRYIYSASAGLDQKFLDEYYTTIDKKWVKKSISMHEGVIVTNKILIDSSENPNLKRHIDICNLELEELSMNCF